VSKDRNPISIAAGSSLGPGDKPSRNRTQTCIPIASDLDIVRARQIGRTAASTLGFSLTDLTLIATAISELARNIVMYAKEGEIIVRLVKNSDKHGIVVIARDQGPGIGDVRQTLQDGYSTSRSLGLGLPGVRRLMDEFEIESQPGQGTVVTVKKWTASAMSVIEWGAAEEVLPGESESGDRYVVKNLPEGSLLAVVDGIGHGKDAAHSAELAAGVFSGCEARSLISLLRRCHERLHGTRGAVVSMAWFSPADDTMTWLGVGNVAGVLLRRAYGVTRQESLLLRAGTVGAPLPHISASVVPVSTGDTLIFATDGIRSGFADGLNANNSPQEIAEHIIRNHWRRNDDALVLVARYVHKSESAS